MAGSATYRQQYIHYDVIELNRLVSAMAAEVGRRLGVHRMALARVFLVLSSWTVR